MERFISAAKREYKDRLFKAIFGRDTSQSKRWRLDLYNALNGTSYADPDALELNTIENVIYITMRNDISFLIGSQMNLYEQQSTFNPNMPLRGFFYFSQLYQMHLTKNLKSLLSGRLLRIPSPRFLVFYNGSESEPDSWKLRLSDSFLKADASQNGDFEWTATVVNIHKNRNKALQKNCKALYDYVRYVDKMAANKRAGMQKSQAVNEAVSWAIREELLDGFFRTQKAEVIGMSLTEFDEEEFKRVCREDGMRDKAEESARALFENGVSEEIIAKSLKMTLEEVRAIAAQADPALA